MNRYNIVPLLQLSHVVSGPRVEKVFTMLRVWRCGSCQSAVHELFITVILFFSIGFLWKHNSIRNFLVSYIFVLRHYFIFLIVHIRPIKVIHQRCLSTLSSYLGAWQYLGIYNISFPYPFSIAWWLHKVHKTEICIPAWALCFVCGYCSGAPTYI